MLLKQLKQQSHSRNLLQMMRQCPVLLCNTVSMRSFLCPATTSSGDNRYARRLASAAPTKNQHTHAWHDKTAMNPLATVP